MGAMPGADADQPTTLLRDVRPWGADLVDVELRDGRIQALHPTGTPGPAGVVEVAGRGRLLLPSFADVHVHLDSTRLGLPFRPHTGGPGVWPMMMNDRRNWRAAETSIAERTTHTLGLMVARGCTRVRSYAQVDVDCGLERLEAVLAAKEAHRDRAEVTVMAFPQAGLLREEGSAQVLERALAAGADVVGGIDPCQLDRDPVRHLDIVFGLAERFGVPVDVHLHEPDQLALFSTELVLERTRALGMSGQVTISHGYGLADLPETTRGRLFDQMAELDVAMATVAPPTPLPLTELAARGVRVGLGEDGQRDYWSPYGNGDMLDRTWQLAFTSRFRADELVEHAVALATVGGRSVIDPAVRPPAIGSRPGVAVGDPADLVLLSGDTVTAAVMDRSPDRTVLRRGRVVADQLELIP